MHEGIARYTSRLFPKTLGHRKQVFGKQDYKARLWSTSADDAHHTDLKEAVVCPYAEQVRRVIGGPNRGVAFQSLAVASLQTLHTVLACEKQAAAAAISLAQGEKLSDMIETSETTAAAIADALDDKGLHMLNLTPGDGTGQHGDTSWWFALTETIQAIEDGTNRILSLASGQPKGGPGRQLSSVVVRLLRNQHHRLLSEADAWIS